MAGVTAPMAMGMLHAQSAMICALAATHPRPAQLLAAFVRESEQTMAIALAGPTDEEFVKALEYWIAELQAKIRATLPPIGK